MMQGQDDQNGFERRRDAWRAAREAKRAAWRMRRAARRAHWMKGWEHLGDPKFWGLDAESMRAGMNHGMNSGMHAGMGMGFGSQPSREVDDLKAKVADMEKIIASLSQRVIVLERLAVNDDARLAAEIEKLRTSET